MNKETIDKWLENEYGVSYTRLEELHDFVIEQDLKHQEQKDKEILEHKHRINDLIKDNTEYKLENLRLNNIINTFEEDLEREVNISEQDSMVGNYRYTVIHSTLEKMLKYFKELKESGNNE